MGGDENVSKSDNYDENKKKEYLESIKNEIQ
jgi:hypothetical protein